MPPDSQPRSGEAAASRPNRLFRAREAAQYLGISERSLWTLSNMGDLPVIRIGRAVRYDIRDLDQWIEERKSRGPAR